MSIISRLLRRRRVYGYGTRATYVLGRTPGELYKTQPELRAVVSYIQDAIASTPLKVYTRADDNDRRRDRTSEAAQLFMSPSDGMTTFQLVERIVGDICLEGAALSIIAPDSKRACGWELRPIPYGWVERVITEDGFTPSRYIVRNPDAGTEPVEIDASITIRFARYNPDGTVDAVSPVESLKQVLAERMNALDYRNALWRNGGWISRWISRPEGVAWTDEQRKRFATSWKMRFSGGGEDATDSGGTPVLEDGMQLHDTTLNAREAQFVESTKLTREEVCAAYHINPSLIYHTDTQTYASAKDNARALYAEGLMPLMDLITEQMNKVLLPMMGADPRSYVVFDLSSKLSASFEEQAAVLTSSVGAPWMTADEARARLDMPALGGAAAQLVQPLNLAYGDGGASNTLSGEPETKSAPKREIVRMKSRTYPDAPGTAELGTLLTRFFDRQSKRVLADIDREKAKAADGVPWWDAKRWNKELADDLEPVFLRLTARSGRATLARFGIAGAGYDVNRTEAYVRKMAEHKAAAINAVTLRQLQAALKLTAEEVDESGAIGATPSGVFDKAKESRAVGAAVAFATAAAVWGGMEAARQCDGNGWERFKTWRHVGNPDKPRPEHEAMDGETVPFDEPFSNGAQWPHDYSLGPDESCWCRCQVEIILEREV